MTLHRFALLIGLMFAAMRAPGEPSPSSYSLSAGPAVEIQPTYPGAKTQRTFVLPDVEGEYHDWLYISGTDLLGVYAYNHGGTKAGAAIEYDFTERLARDDAHLEHLGDVSTTPRFKLFYEPQLAPWLAGGIEVATDIGGHHEGTVAAAHVALLLPLTARGFVSVGPGVTWNDSAYMQTFFGVSAEQNLVSGLPVYSARAGLSDLHGELLAGYQLSSRWTVVLDVTQAYLVRDAAHSPFTEAHAQTTWLGTILYRWR
jgi:MipA family protein